MIASNAEHDCSPRTAGPGSQNPSRNWKLNERPLWENGEVGVNDRLWVTAARGRS